MVCQLWPCVVGSLFSSHPGLWDPVSFNLFKFSEDMNPELFINSENSPCYITGLPKFLQPTY